MSLTDPIANYLTMIRNASQAKHSKVDIPGSILLKKMTEILLQEGYIRNFTMVEDKLEVIPIQDLPSGILCSPDDPDATKRKKRKINSRGYVGHLSETSNPENKLNLITDMVVAPNNKETMFKISIFNHHYL